MKFTDTCGAAVSFRFRFSVLSVLFLPVVYETHTVLDGIQTSKSRCCTLLACAFLGLEGFNKSQKS